VGSEPLGASGRRRQVVLVAILLRSQEARNLLKIQRL
jgi:hypothetical protein